MAVVDQKVWPTESSRELAIEIEKCIQLYMNRDETARSVETHIGIDRQTTQMVWDRLAELNQELFQNYYIRLVLIRQIVRYNQLLEQQHRAMILPTVLVEQRMSMGLAETAPQDDSPASVLGHDDE